jgi:hypothetical protein|tara:strand:- start:227 stop:499 length:273 start_codon:yes stop_codon:yes gene_type:complete
MRVINYIKKQLMAFRDIFKDDNDINEKNVVGFASFAVMTIFAFSDLITGHMGKDLVINELIYNSFVIITLGSFGISEVGKIWSKKNKTEE